MQEATRIDYPDAPRVGVVDELFGHRVADPYRYLEDPDDPRTKDWSAAQERLLTERSGDWVGRDHWRRRIGELLAAGGVSAPTWRGERQFFLRRDGGEEHARLLTVDPDGTERVLVDPTGIDPTLRTTLDAWQPSQEGDLLAYQLSESGTEDSVLRVMDVATGEILDGPVDRTRYSPVAWLPGGEAFYYVRRLDPALLPAGEEQFHRRVWLHRVGTDPEQDVLVFGEGRLHTEYYGVSVSRDGRWLLVSASEGTAPRNDLWIADLSGADGSSPAAPRLQVVQEHVDAQSGGYVGRDGRLYVLTDLDAPRNRLAVTDPAAPASEHWVDLVPEDPQAVLDGFAVLDGARLPRPLLLVSWTRHAVSELTVHDLRTGERTGEVALPGLGSISGVVERPEGGHEAWFGYTDHVTVGAVHRYDALTGETTLWASPPGTVAVPAVRSAHVAYRSLDGTIVRMFVLSPATEADLPPDVADRPRPTILYGYGGFGLPLTPAYSATTLAWVEAGGVYAVAGLRGGGEEGEEWHRAGMLAQKHHTFEDFHAAAEWLVDNGFTTPEQLSINGGSNGGLLVGAALTQHPDRYAAVVCSAPLLDMVRYEQFGLGATWNVEYGTAADPEQLEWLLAYSPYHHVRDGVDYPAVLFTVFDGDTRVDPMHGRKMAAALQHASSSDRPVLLRTERDVGHGARALSRTVDLSADVLAFTARWTGLQVRSP